MSRQTAIAGGDSTANHGAWGCVSIVPIKGNGGVLCNTVTSPPPGCAHVTPSDHRRGARAHRGGWGEGAFARQGNGAHPGPSGRASITMDRLIRISPMSYLINILQNIHYGDETTWYAVVS